MVEDGIWCVVLSKVACLLESRFVADVGKDRRDGILGRLSHSKKRLQAGSVWPRMHAFADHLPNTKSTVNSGFFKGNADELPRLHRTTDR